MCLPKALRSGTFFGMTSVGRLGLVSIFPGSTYPNKLNALSSWASTPAAAWTVL